MPDPTRRLYTISDAYMLEHGKTMRGHFVDDQTAFVAEDSNYANPFEDDWQTAIADAEGHPTQEQREDQLMQLTDAVLKAMADCRDEFQNAKRYIKKAFPTGIAYWNEFGFDDYGSIDDSQPNMIQFMRRFHATALKYAAELALPAVNFPQARIDGIEAAGRALDDANNAQEKFKGDMFTFTQQRVEAMNAVWGICTDVANVGKMLFRADYARYQHYLLPASEEPAGTLVLSGTITDSSTGDPVAEALTELQPHGLQATADSNGMYGFGTAPAGEATLRITHPDHMEQNLPVTIDPKNPQVLDVQMMPAGTPPP